MHLYLLSAIPMHHYLGWLSHIAVNCLLSPFWIFSLNVAPGHGKERHIGQVLVYLWSLSVYGSAQARVIAIKNSQLKIVDLSIFYILEGEKFRSWGVPYIFLCDNVSERFSGCGHAGTFCIFLNSSSGRWRSLTRPPRHLSPLWSHGIYERAQRSDQSLFCKPANHRRLSQHYPSGRTLPVFTNWNTQCPFVQDIWR